MRWALTLGHRAEVWVPLGYPHVYSEIDLIAIASAAVLVAVATVTSGSKWVAVATLPNIFKHPELFFAFAVQFLPRYAAVVFVGLALMVNYHAVRQVVRLRTHVCEKIAPPRPDRPTNFLSPSLTESLTVGGEIITIRDFTDHYPMYNEDISETLKCSTHEIGSRPCNLASYAPDSDFHLPGGSPEDVISNLTMIGEVQCKEAKDGSLTLIEVRTFDALNAPALCEFTFNNMVAHEATQLIRSLLGEQPLVCLALCRSIARIAEGCALTTPHEHKKVRHEVASRMHAISRIHEQSHNSSVPYGKVSLRSLEDLMLHMRSSNQSPHYNIRNGVQLTDAHQLWEELLQLPISLERLEAAMIERQHGRIDVH